MTTHHHGIVTRNRKLQHDETICVYLILEILDFGLIGDTQFRQLVDIGCGNNRDQTTKYYPDRNA